jgi:protein SCO1
VGDSPWVSKCAEVAHCSHAEFHPDFIALTGSNDDIARIAKLYRVYHSASIGAYFCHQCGSLAHLPSSADPSDPNDYLVDHTIIQYLMDPEGKFVTYFGLNSVPEESAKKIKFLMRRFAREKAAAAK